MKFASGAVTATDGSLGDVHETLGGYLVVDVADPAEAVALATSWPIGETIEIR